MNTQAKVALDKQKYPERYCKEPRCLWKVVWKDRDTNGYEPKADCPNGRCWRHQVNAPTSLVGH